MGNGARRSGNLKLAKNKTCEGICSLTKRRGKFVKAHLIPKALTKPAVAGFPFVENMPGGRPARKWNSWYDSKLVTAEGEAVLAALDNWAIPELRKQKLVWSGWGPLQSLPHGHDHDPIRNTGFGLRKVSGLDANRLRLFFLSLLWRAAASTHYGFAEIKLPPQELEELREMLLANDPGAPTYFAIHLIQISTFRTGAKSDANRSNKNDSSGGGRPRTHPSNFPFLFRRACCAYSSGCGV
jgi:hypothetical protein